MTLTTAFFDYFRIFYPLVKSVYTITLIICVYVRVDVMVISRLFLWVSEKTDYKYNFASGFFIEHMNPVNL